MPKIYLSPSTQEYNQFYSEGSQRTATNTEEYYMNLIADAMVPYLLANNIQYKRNTPEMTVSEIISDSNAYQPDIHVAIHSNSSPPGYEGILQGPDVYYYPSSVAGKRASELVGEQMREIYPNPDLIAVMSNNTLAELTRTNAPAVYVETAYHDNPTDAAWIKSNINEIARAISTGLVEYFGKEFKEPAKLLLGEVAINEGNLNIRNAPSTNAAVVGKLANKDPVVILRKVPGWFLIAANGINGYVDSRYIKVL